MCWTCSCRSVWPCHCASDRRHRVPSPSLSGGGGGRFLLHKPPCPSWARFLLYWRHALVAALPPALPSSIRPCEAPPPCVSMRTTSSGPAAQALGRFDDLGPYRRRPLRVQLLVPGPALPRQPHPRVPPQGTNLLVHGRSRPHGTKALTIGGHKRTLRAHTDNPARSTVKTTTSSGGGTHEHFHRRPHPQPARIPRRHPRTTR